MSWTEIADNKTIERAAKALSERGFETVIVDSKDEAKKKVLEFIPEGSEVFEASSATLNEIGVTDEIQNSGRYKSAKKELMSINDEKLRGKKRKTMIASEYTVGSAQAITEDGTVVVASASGSQIGAYVYGAEKLILVVGAQKVVKNLDEAIKRIYEYALPLESERVKKVYNMPRSSVNKIFIFEREMPGRVKIVIVKEKLGF
ncbi:MAG: lactate utilization protein [Candidatus Micrarchaeota archaeon]|nr:lactate utilization protein [Candidatus Micrarchaeota archaeon]MDE1833785.1 lactate utilization protein [Candidatus Micrarchaeota archaeon]